MTLSQTPLLAVYGEPDEYERKMWQLYDDGTLLPEVVALDVHRYRERLEIARLRDEFRDKMEKQQERFKRGY